MDPHEHFQQLTDFCQQTSQVPFFKTSEPLGGDIKIVKMEPEEDPEEFLLAYEYSADGSLWSKEQCTAPLGPPFSGSDLVSDHGFQHCTAEDYDRMKGVMIDETDVCEESFRKRFRNVTFTAEAKPRLVVSQLQDWCRKWLKPEMRSSTEIVELVIMEQFIQILPTGAREWLSQLHVSSVNSAVLLIEGYMAGEASKSASSDLLTSTRKEEEPPEEPRLGVRKKCKACNVKLQTPEQEPSHTQSLQQELSIGSSSERDTSLENIQPQTESKPPAAQKVYQCTECGKGFRKNSNYLKHQKAHAGESFYVCSICRESFSRAVDWNKHQTTHAPDKPHSCAECGKRFRQAVGLLKHQQMHQEDKPFPCDACGKSFLRLSHLLSHQKVHTGDKPFSCTECGKSFSWSSDLTRHHRIHTGEKPYKCSECGKGFSESSNMLRHTRIHMGSHQSEVCVADVPAFKTE